MAAFKPPQLPGLPADFQFPELELPKDLQLPELSEIGDAGKKRKKSALELSHTSGFKVKLKCRFFILQCLNLARELILL